MKTLAIVSRALFSRREAATDLQVSRLQIFVSLALAAIAANMPVASIADQEPAPIEGTLFVDQFDSLAKAEAATGSSAIQTQDVSLVPGKWGQGVEIKPSGFVAIPETGKVVSREAGLVADLIGFCQRKFPGNGVALYWYGSLDDAQIDALRTGPFCEAARPAWLRAAHGSGADQTQP